MKLFLFLLLMSSCASSSVDNMPMRDLSEMTLILNLNEDGTLKGFRYPYRKCVKSFLGVCTNWDLVNAYFDAKDSERMKQLKSMDFVLKQRSKP